MRARQGLVQKRSSVFNDVCAMNHLINSERRSLGVTFPTSNEAHITLWAPVAKQIAVKVHRNHTTIPLQKEAYGYWHLATSQLNPGDLYTFVIEGRDEFPDPVSLCQPQGVHGPSQAVDTAAFRWTDEAWKNPPLESYLLYELHTGTFTPEGTLQAIERKLDYLKTLGINAIEIMPVAQFSDTRNWGYDGVYTFAVQNSYGGAEGLQHLVNACHAKGLAVVLDVVYNHFGPEGSYVNEFGPYLTNKYQTPWGDAINFDDAWCDGVRQYFLENALMWLRDFHVDALRIDAVHAIKDFGPVHILQDLRQQVDQLMQVSGRRHYLLVESDLNDPRVIDPLDKNGFGMDAQWLDGFHHALRVAAGEKQVGYYADFNGVTDLAKAYRDGYVYDGQFSIVRHKFFGRKAETDLGQQFIVFSQNHDQIGNRKLGERSGQLFSRQMLKLLAGAVLTSPCLPLLFMGEEWGETNPFRYFVSHSEPELARAVRQGRRDEFADIRSGQPDEEVPDPLSIETFTQSKLQWTLPGQDPHRALLHYYQTLIALRRQLPALHCLNRRQLNVFSDAANETLLVYRWHNDQHVLCLMNFSSQPQSVAIPAVGQSGMNWLKLLDSTDQQWQSGTVTAAVSVPVSASQPLLLPPESFLLYAQLADKSAINFPEPIPARLFGS